MTEAVAGTEETVSVGRRAWCHMELELELEGCGAGADGRGWEVGRVSGESSSELSMRRSSSAMVSVVRARACSGSSSLSSSSSITWWEDVGAESEAELLPVE